MSTYPASSAKKPLVHMLSKHSKVLDICILVLIALLGVVLVVQVTLYSKDNAKRHFTAKATLLAEALSPHDIAQLQGKPQDINTVAYIQTVQRIQAVKKALPDIRFAYLMKQVGEDIVFISDSEPLNSTYSSAYGEKYHEATPELRQMFADGRPLFEGPVTDKWGNWVSAIAAIKDADGRVIAVAGMDIEASEWLMQMRWYQITALFMTFLLLALFCLSVFFYLAMRRWREAEAENRYQAIHDNLTGLHNRFFMQSMLHQRILQSKKNNEHFGILFIDLNGLKKINDQFGHAAGDALIVEIGKKIQSQLSQNAQVGRLGGDEFVAILNSTQDRVQAEIIATHLRHVIAQPLQSSLVQGLSVTSSIGIAMYPEDGADIDALLSTADSNMYQEKSFFYQLMSG